HAAEDELRRRVPQAPRELDDLPLRMTLKRRDVGRLVELEVVVDRADAADGGDSTDDERPLPRHDRPLELDATLPRRHRDPVRVGADMAEGGADARFED